MTVSSQVKQTMASLNGAKGTLRAYITQVQDVETKEVYQIALKELDQITKDIEKRLQLLELEEPQYKGY